MSTFDSTHAPVATVARAAGTGLVSMSTRPDIPGMLHLEREARDWSMYNKYSYRIPFERSDFLIDTSLSTYQGGVRIVYHIRTTWYQLVCTWYEPAPKILIRAKRVSNCYMQEKKTDRLSDICTHNLLVLVWKNCLGSSVRSGNRKRPKHGIPLPVQIHSF